MPNVSSVCLEIFTKQVKEVKMLNTFSHALESHGDATYNFGLSK